MRSGYVHYYGFNTIAGIHGGYWSSRSFKFTSNEAYYGRIGNLDVAGAYSGQELAGVSLRCLVVGKV